MRKPITAYLDEIEATYGKSIRKAYSDFYFALYHADNVDAFVKVSLENGFEVTTEWLKEYLPDINF